MAAFRSFMLLTGNIFKVFLFLNNSSFASSAPTNREAEVQPSRSRTLNNAIAGHQIMIMF